MTRPTILVIDDEEYTLSFLQGLLEDNNCTVFIAKSGEEGLGILEKEVVDLVFLDQRMPGMSGMETYSAIKKMGLNVPVIMMTGYASVAEAVGAMKAGAHDYLTKPFENPDEIEAVVEKALRYRKLEDENKYLREQISEAFSFEGMIGKSEGIKKVIVAVRKVAPLDSTVMIEGESGTGKELVARAIHQLSLRKEKRFVAVNCAALPDTLLESMLFGFEKGAFTGALRTTPGFFEEAEGGTIFLDEVSEMSQRLQASLLRVLQEKEFSRLGSGRVIKADFRVITASNKDLRGEVKAGSFREDLFYRLSVVPVSLPPLRDRKEDIPLLASRFLESFCKKNRNKIGPFSPDALAALESYPWNGNVRELKNAIEAISAFKQAGPIEVDDLPGYIRMRNKEGFIPDDKVLPYKEEKDLFERRYLEKAIEQSGGSITKAASLSGIKRQNLYDKLKRYGLR